MEDHSAVGPSELMSLDLLCSTLLWLVLGVCKRVALADPELNVRKYPSDVDYHCRPTSPPDMRRRRYRVIGTVRTGLDTLFIY